MSSLALVEPLLQDAATARSACCNGKAYVLRWLIVSFCFSWLLSVFMYLHSQGTQLLAIQVSANSMALRHQILTSSKRARNLGMRQSTRDWHFHAASYRCCPQLLHAATGSPASPDGPAVTYTSPLVVEGFLSPTECADVIDMAQGLLEPSVVGLASSNSTLTAVSESTQCTSWCATLEHQAVSEHPTMRAIAERVEVLTGLPMDHQESLHIVRYTPGQEFRPHFDTEAHGDEEEALWLEEGMGLRRYTVIMYLNEGFEGGKTAFPELNTAVTPKAGAALLFSNLLPEEGGTGARPNPASLHAGEVVTAGEKWVANCWVRERNDFE
eukprot:gnl/TRDRNA2_/TRDRNA2_94236_c0_seq2.p1 gnl/TRDRNA2_/TRDRNA2_94236_c0~~gnl/TRDRNA2_/TRDRNA2_94236_c0_seq2.p1  ORF type:complete len:326 (+),score=33.54 gnl/TRDRNA2_/TRDRNA2_94236_c0_seq2:48-1025(+)